MSLTYDALFSSNIINLLFQLLPYISKMCVTRKTNRTILFVIKIIDKLLIINIGELVNILFVIKIIYEIIGKHNVHK
jgi:hypothetical protein